MSDKTNRPAAVDLSLLNQIRLDEDLTWRELGGLTGVHYATLQALMTADNPRPYDRTLHKIRRFLEAREPKPRKKQRSARAVEARL